MNMQYLLDDAEKLVETITNMGIDVADLLNNKDQFKQSFKEDLYYYKYISDIYTNLETAQSDLNDILFEIKTRYKDT